MTKNYVAYWRQKVALRETPFFASALSDLKPTKVATDCGPHVSVVFSPGGLRYFCFTSQANRDRFLTYYRRVFNARPCTNPYP